MTAAGAARDLHASLQHLRDLPDDLEIFPAHFAGSACGRRLSGKPSSTLGYERRYNAALRLLDADAFVAFMLDDLPSAQYRVIRAQNQRGAAAAPGE